MSIATMILMVVAVLIFFGLVQRVLDRMYLTDRAALILVGCMLLGTLVPNLAFGLVQVNIGGCLIPLGVSVYLLVKADSSRERIRTCAGAILTAAAVYALGVLLPDEPETLPMEPTLLYGLAAGLIACVFGRSRRGAFVCGVMGVLLADIAGAIVVWSRGTEQVLMLGGAGLVDTVVISSVIAVLITEMVGEIVERITRKEHKVGEKN